MILKIITLSLAFNTLQGNSDVSLSAKANPSVKENRVDLSLTKGNNELFNIYGKPAKTSSKSVSAKPLQNNNLKNKKIAKVNTKISKYSSAKAIAKTSKNKNNNLPVQIAKSNIKKASNKSSAKDKNTINIAKDNKAPEVLAANTNTNNAVEDRSPIKIIFGKDSGIVKGVSIVSKGEKIGDVTSIQLTIGEKGETKYLVEASIDKQKRSFIKDGTIAMITLPKNSPSQVVELISPQSTFLTHSPDKTLDGYSSFEEFWRQK